MKAVFISEIGDHIILTLDMDRAELAACTKSGEDGDGALTKAVLAACRDNGVLPEPSPVIPEQTAPVPSVESSDVPFRAEHYKGIEIQHALEGQDSLSPEELTKEWLLDAVIEKNDIYIPPEQIAGETDIEFEARAQMLKYESLISGDYTLYEGYGSREDREQVERDVIRQIKVEKILKSIIEQENLAATREELEAKARDISEKRQIDFDMVERFFGEDFSLLEGDLLREKAVNLIYENAVFLDGSETVK